MKMAEVGRFANVEEEEISQIINSSDPIPVKTKRQTAWSVSVFKEWLLLRYPNETLETLNEEVLAERLSRFYLELKQKDGSDYSRSAHMSIRAGINRYLTSDTIGKTFSIISNPIFKKANKALTVKLKKIRESGVLKVKHHTSIRADDIRKCYESGVFGGYSPVSLLRVNWFNINLYFCRRGRESQRKLTKNSFVFKKDANQVEYVELSEEEKTKTHPASISDRGADEGNHKMFSTGAANCPVQYLKKLISVLHPAEEALFQRPRRFFSPNLEIWYERAPLGVNSLANMMKEISMAAKLSEIYTNHCVKATSVTLLNSVHRVMQLPGHRNEASVKVYLKRESLQQERQSLDNQLTAPVVILPITTNATPLASEPVQQSKQKNENKVKKPDKKLEDILKRISERAHRKNQVIDHEQMQGH